jgi:hypothetical protein
MLFPEANRWRQGMQDVSAAIDETMGEMVTVTPVVTKPNHTPVPFPDAEVTVTAVFTSRSVQTFKNDRAPSKQGEGAPAMLVKTSQPIFSFSTRAVPFRLARQHKIRRLCTGELFEITGVEPDGVARVVCTVNQLGKQNYLERQQ